MGVVPEAGVRPHDASLKIFLIFLAKIPTFVVLCRSTVGQGVRPDTWLLHGNADANETEDVESGNVPEYPNPTVHTVLWQYTRSDNFLNEWCD